MVRPSTPFLRFAFVGFLLAGSPSLTAQQPYAQYGSGVATMRSTFNPRTAILAPRIPQTATPPVVLPRPSVIPPGEYQKRKAVAPRIPQSVAASIQARTPWGDPVPAPRLPLSLAPTLGFAGIPNTQYTPPSSNIAVGPEDVIQTVNSVISRFSRSGELTSSIDLLVWFAGSTSTVCPGGSCIVGDVTITYDQIHGHFILMAHALNTNNSTSYLMLSVSNTARFGDAWTNWILDMRKDGSTDTTNWGDFPQPGLDANAFYVTTLQFSFSTFVYQYSKVRIIRKTDLYNFALQQLPYRDIFNLMNEDGTPASTLQVPHLRGRVEVGTSTGVMVNSSDVEGADYYTLWLINNPVSDNPTVTRHTLKNVWKYGYPAAAPQLGSAVKLDTGPASIAKAVMRDGLVYFALNTGYTDEPVTVTYSVVDVANKKVTLQQRWTNGNFFYPAFDVPASTGPGNTLPNNLIVGTTTAAGALSYAGVSGVKTGENAYTVSGNGTEARWGDYFGASVDPIQGGLWITGEYAKSLVSWGTWNAYFPWATSQEFTDVPPTSSAFSPVNVMRLWGITQGCTPTAFCPQGTLTRRQMAVFIIRALYGDTFAYPGTPYFTDVPVSDSTFPYVQKMRELGITVGCTATAFCPEMPLERWMGATFIIRAKMMKLFGDSFAFPPTGYFTDVPANHVAFPFVQKMRELGYTVGCTATEFCPQQPLTREAAAVFLVRAFLN